MKLLEMLKIQGAALVVCGPEACGKTTLINNLTAGMKVAYAPLSDIEGHFMKFTPWLNDEPDVVIVEGFPGGLHIHQLKDIVSNPTIWNEQMMKPSREIRTPVFVFMSNDPATPLLIEGNRRFAMINLEKQR